MIEDQTIRRRLEDALDLVTEVREELRANRLVGTPMWTYVSSARADLESAVGQARYGS